MSTSVGQVGIYRPRSRLSATLSSALSAHPSLRVPASDEDGVTMSWEALRVMGRPAAPVENLVVAGGVPELNHRAVAAHLTATGSIPAGVPAGAAGQGDGAAGVIAERARASEPSMVLLTDEPPRLGGGQAGADTAAVAFLEGSGEAFEVLSTATETTLSFDSWAGGRGPGDPRFVEESLLRPVGSRLLRDLCRDASINLGDVTAVVHSPIPISGRWAAKWGVSRVVTSTGDGARPANTFAVAMEQLASGGPGTLVAVMDLGWGGDAVLLEAGPQIATAVTFHESREGHSVELEEWLADGNPEDSTIWTSAPKLWREMPGLLGLRGTRCPACGDTAFPARLSCEQCGELALKSHDVQHSGTVVSHNVDRLYAAPTREIQMVVLELDDGGRFFGQLTEDSPRWAKVDDRGTLVLRRLHDTDQLPHYFWKVALDD